MLCVLAALCFGQGLADAHVPALIKVMFMFQELTLVECLMIIQGKLETCSESTWKLIQNSSFPTGHAKLQIKIDKV